MAPDTSKTVSEIDRHTKEGTILLQQGNLGKAKDCFESAYQKCYDLKEAHTERACAFNVGAILVALNEAQKGLQYLQKAIPPHNQRDGKSNGDLYFNFGLAYETLKKDSEAVKYYELAFEEYQIERDNVHMEAEIARRAGTVYSRLQSPLQAARSFGIAARSYAQLQEFDQQALSLCQQAVQFLQSKRFEDSIQSADDCMVLCQRVQKQGELGKLYNELGLIYTQCHDFHKSATCFELALPVIRGLAGDKRCEATILQNLGAVYNSLGDYQRALGFHESAASLFAEVGSRASQGQCFINLAFAYSQLGITDTAGECYLHAVQAAKDGGDKRGQWQGMEGLGAVYFIQGQIDKAVAYFKLALRMLSESGENNQVAQERIVAKLTDALQFQVGSPYDASRSTDKRITRTPSVQSASIVPTTIPTVAYKPDILLNDLPRPPTRDEQRQMQKIRSDLMRGRVPNALGYIAQGIGEYSTDDDISISSSKRNARSKRPQSSKPRRPTSARPQSSQDHIDSKHRSMGMKEIKPETITEEKSKPPMSTSRRESKQSMGIRGLDGKYKKTYHRRQRRGLLRTDTNNSEDEWNAHVRDAILSDASISDESHKYKERLRPPSTDEEAQTDPEAISTIDSSQKHRNKQRVKEILKKKPGTSDPKGEQDNEAFPLKVGAQTSKVMTPGQIIKQETSSSAEGDDDEDDDNGHETGIETIVESRADTSRPDSRDDDEYLMQYQHRIRRLSVRDDEDGTDDIESEKTSGDSETINSEDQHKRTPPAVPALSPPQTMKNMIGTYEQPLPYKPPNETDQTQSEEESSDSEEETEESDKESFHGGGVNFFRTPTPKEENSRMSTRGSVISENSHMSKRDSVLSENSQMSKKDSVISENSHMSKRDSETLKLYQAIDSYSGEEPGDLSFHSGEILKVFKTRSDGWMEAENSQEKRGLVPITYFKMYESKPVEGGTMKKTVADPEDPLYQTIKNFSQEAKPGSSDTPGDQSAPQLPPRNTRIDDLSRAEQEEYLRKLHQQQSTDRQHSYAGSSVYGDEDNVHLPQRKQSQKEEKDRRSKACLIM